MRCRDLDRILNDHAVASLSRAERGAVDEHLRACGRCAPLWQAHELLTAVPAVAAPAGLFERVLARVDAADRGGLPVDSRGPEPLRRLTVPFGIAAAAALVALLLLLPEAQESEGISGEVGAVASAEKVDGVEAIAARSAGSGAPGAADLPASEFIEGIHYRVVATPAADDPDAKLIEIEEFFMYGCLHCYTFEGLFDPWCEIQPEYVNVTRVPVVFNALAGMHARAFYTAELLGIDERIHREMLIAIHERGESLATEAELARFATRFGVAEEVYVETFRSAEVTARLGAAMTRSRELDIRATPTVIIGGRYEVSPGLAGSYENMLAVADQLIVQIRGQE